MPKINPLTGLPEDDTFTPTPLDGAPPIAAAPALAPAADPYADLFKSFQEKQQKLADEQNQYDTKGAITGALASLAAGFQGGNSLDAVNKTMDRRREDKKTESAALEKWKADKVEELKTKRAQELAGREDKQYVRSQDIMKQEDDPESPQSQLAQSLVKKMVPQFDASGMSKTKIFTLLPSMEKIYDVEQKRLSRQDALKEKRDVREEKASSGMTEGRKALDKDYAKDFNEWTSTGRSSLEKNIQALVEARDALTKDPDLSGGLTGAFGDRMTADKVLKQRQKVRGAVQNSLKATLGAQFTEKEGERILTNAYNEAASADTNKESLNALIKKLQEDAAANDRKAAYFSQKGTLTGLDSGPPMQANKEPTKKEIAKTQTNKKTGEKRIVYTDGSIEVIKPIASGGQ